MFEIKGLGGRRWRRRRAPGPRSTLPCPAEGPWSRPCALAAASPNRARKKVKPAAGIRRCGAGRRGCANRPAQSCPAAPTTNRPRWPTGRPRARPPAALHTPRQANPKKTRPSNDASTPQSPKDASTPNKKLRISLALRRGVGALDAGIPKAPGRRHDGGHVVVGGVRSLVDWVAHDNCHGCEATGLRWSNWTHMTPRAHGRFAGDGCAVNSNAGGLPRYSREQAALRRK